MTQSAARFAKADANLVGDYLATLDRPALDRLHLSLDYRVHKVLDIPDEERGLYALLAAMVRGEKARRDEIAARAERARPVDA
ncbi:hypothetical protein GCM10023215_39520 [Pseudonocardia yuanmonensis]|uniref:Uncharacterized protein n=1 Tax=Pseudonocardia yuanmonensis TaxID=1095914 RepID=A0ABP8X0Z5_9PSEU